MAIYYVDPVDGNDGNAGTSEGAGNAWLTIQKGMDTAVAGDTVNYKNNGTYTLSSAINIDTNTGDIDNHIIHRGYSSTPGDGGRINIVGSGSHSVFISTAGKDYIQYANMNIDCNGLNGSEGASFTNSDYCIFENITLSNMSNNIAFRVGIGNYLSNIKAHSCSSSNIAHYGIFTNTNCSLNGCYVYNCTDVMSAYSLGSGTEANFIIASKCNGIAIRLNTPNTVSNFVFDGGTGSTSDAVSIANRAAYMRNGIIINYDSVGAYAIGGGSADRFPVLDSIGYYNNTNKYADATKAVIRNEVDFSVDPFTDSTNGDYTLNSLPTGGTLAVQAGDPAVMPDEVGSASNINIGVQQTAPSSASAPIFAGITGIERVAQGQLKVSWSAGTGTITGYKIFVRKGSAPTFTDDTYLWGTVDDTKTSVVINTEEDNDTLFYGDGAIYVGVRAINCPATGEDTNTVTAHLTPDGGLMLNNQKIQVLKVN